MLLCTAKKLTDQEINELIKTIHLKKSRDRIAMAFIGIASTIALRYAHSTGLDADDLQSEALLAVVDAISRFHNVNHNNIGGYINRYIHQYCLRYIKKFLRQGVDVTEHLFTNDNIVSTIIAYDLIDQIAKTDIEREIIEYKLQGYSDYDISLDFNCSRQSVWKIRKTLARRLLKCLVL